METEVEKKMVSELKNAAMLRSKSGGSKQGLAALFWKQSSVAISKDTVLASSTANKMEVRPRITGSVQPHRSKIILIGIMLKDGIV